MPEVLIDITRLLDRYLQGRLPTGVDRVSLEYLRYFSGRSTALVRYARQWLELSAADSERLYAVLLSSSGNGKHLIRALVAKAVCLSPVRRWFSTPRLLFHTGHSGLEKSAYAKRLQASGLKPIFFVHDLIPISHPEYCRPGEAGKHRFRMQTMLSAGHGLVANSQTTLDELQSYAASNGLPMPPAVTALLAPVPLPTPDAGAPMQEPYFVMLGTIEPRKNHSLILQLWRQLIERLGDKTPRLLIIGQRGWECENVVDLLERCEILQGFVIEHSVCSDAELSTYLHHAQALLFPSFIEGFGLPLVEALMLGVPVIASDLPVFREIAGDVPEYANPLDGKRWQDLIIEYAQANSRMRLNQCERMLTYQGPSWSAHFDQVEALMAQVNISGLGNNGKVN